ncbi:MAG: tetratricopeptide repeat protein [Alphaproteobacteria bacterium]|nr:tetratricopeptide repeat protein [Alphaproteobacteria bacterium]
MKKNAEKNDKPQSNEAEEKLLREVEQDLKNDRLVAFWKQYGLYLVIFVVLVLSFAVSFETFKVWHREKNQTWSDTYAYALNLQIQGKYDESLKVLNDIVKNNHDIYVDLAKVQISNVLLEQGKGDEATAALEEIISDKNMNSKMRDVSIIKLASYKLDTAPKEEIVALLSPLATTSNSWTNVAKELLAMLEVREGNLAEARKIYTEILESSDLSESLRVRVQDMLSVLNDVEK